MDNSKLCFVSYARDDQKYVEEFLKNFKAYAENSNIQLWKDTEDILFLSEGWHEQIQKVIKSCHIGLFLITEAFISSSYIRLNEFGEILKQNDDKLIVPVVLTLH